MCTEVLWDKSHWRTFPLDRWVWDRAYCVCLAYCLCFVMWSGMWMSLFVYLMWNSVCHSLGQHSSCVIGSGSLTVDTLQVCMSVQRCSPGRRNDSPITHKSMSAWSCVLKLHPELWKIFLYPQANCSYFVIKVWVQAAEHP